LGTNSSANRQEKQSSDKMNFNRVTLAFSDENEKLFLIKYIHDSLKQFRIAFILLIFLYGIFGYLDNLVAGEYIKLFHIIRYGIVVPLLTSVLLLSFSKHFIKVWQPLLFVCFIVAGAGIIIMNLKLPGNYAYYAGMMLIFSAGYFFIRLRFFLATIAGWMTLLLFNLGAVFFSEMDRLTIINNNFFFISANFIGMVAAYNIEFYARRDFFLNKHLDQRNAEIAEANKNLEFKVEERTRELVLAKEDAEKSDRLKSAFLANMSHEIRTPMNGILGFAELLKEPKLSGEEQKEFIGIIEKSGTRMLNIINNLIDISKVEAGEMKVSISETNIDEQLEYIYSLFKAEVENKGMHLVYRKRTDSKVTKIKTDTEKIYAILTNLVKNAIKFTNEGSIEYGYDLRESEIEFFVKDTGIGIPENRQEDIFNRFVQADIDDKLAFQGAGLGLSITKAYVEILGGKIWVKSEVGRGSQFFFLIPYIQVTETEITDNGTIMEKTDRDTIKTLTILIAEDDEASDKLITILLKKISRKVIHVKTGAEAIEVCRNTPAIDLILMDIKMPGINGYEATRQIRKFNKNVVIIAQTSYSLSGDREKAIEAGCNDYISKPITQSSLLNLIMNYI
jgi:signal transduction histidine kinase/CheY-like chemotaxis protein